MTLQTVSFLTQPLCKQSRAGVDPGFDEGGSENCLLKVDLSKGSEACFTPQDLLGSQKRNFQHFGG